MPRTTLISRDTKSDEEQKYIEQFMRDHSEEIAKALNLGNQVNFDGGLQPQPQPFKLNAACSSGTDPLQIPTTRQEQPSQQSKQLLSGSFTEDQCQILKQQMRINVQFAAQYFLQLYKHPINEYRNHAPQLKSFLTEFEKISLDKSIHIENLQPALKLITKWEEDVSKVSDENDEYNKFVFTEYIKTINKSPFYYQLKFPEKMLDAVVESVAFPYPNLLPDMPFRDSNLIISYPIFRSEEYLLALYFEKFDFHKCPSLNKFCTNFYSSCTVNRLFNSIRSLQELVMKRKNENDTGKEESNPIKYYFKHRRAPPIQHTNFTLNHKSVMDSSTLNVPQCFIEHVKTRRNSKKT